MGCQCKYNGDHRDDGNGCFAVLLLAAFLSVVICNYVARHHNQAQLIESIAKPNK